MPRDCPACGLVSPDTTLRCDCGYAFGQRKFVRRPVQTPLISWVFCSALFLFGIFCLCMSFWDGTTLEDELSFAEGVPTDVTLTLVKGRYGHKHYTLKFSVADYRTEFGSDSPKYEEVLSAVTSKVPVEIGVSTRQETLFPRAGWVPLYKMSVNGKPILTYSDVIDNKAERGRGALPVALFLLGASGWGLLGCFRNQRRYLAAKAYSTQ